PDGAGEPPRRRPPRPDPRPARQRRGGDERVGDVRGRGRQALPRRRRLPGRGRHAVRRRAGDGGAGRERRRRVRPRRLRHPPRGPGAPACDRRAAPDRAQRAGGRDPGGPGHGARADGGGRGVGGRRAPVARGVRDADRGTRDQRLRRRPPLRRGRAGLLPQRARHGRAHRHARGRHERRRRARRRAVPDKGRVGDARPRPRRVQPLLPHEQRRRRGRAARGPRRADRAGGQHRPLDRPAPALGDARRPGADEPAAVGRPRVALRGAPALASRWLAALVVAAGLLGSGAAQAPGPAAQSAAPDVGVAARGAAGRGFLAPREHGVWYEVFVRSFQDSDGDGVGDLPGLRSRLPYLAELGVTGLWLMPVHPSPSYHGYDVTDHYAVNPEYGTLDDLLGVLHDAHALGMRVILDLVPNHTSSQHPWFRAALAGDPAYRDRYVWSDDPPPWRGTFGGSAWHAADGAYYLGLFSPDMPDLNHADPAVEREVHDVAAFWLGLGFDGFRVDAIQHVVEGEGGVIANAPENYAWVARFQAHVDAVAPGAVVLGETWTDMPAIARYHTEAGLHAATDYPLYQDLVRALLTRSTADLAFGLAQAEAMY